MNNYNLCIDNNEATYSNTSTIYSLPPQDEFFLNNIISEIYRTTPIITFKSLFSEVASASQQQPISEDLKYKTQRAFRYIIKHVTTMLYQTDRFTQQQRDIVGKWMHQEFISFCLLGSWPSRSWRKPQNIAGDHHMIKQIYQAGNEEKRTVGQVVNHCFFEEPACRAVLNRKHYIKNSILEKISSNNGQCTSVASIASGPAEELFEVYEQLGKDQRPRLKAAGIDIDKRACASVDDKITENRLQHHFSTYATDILKLKPLPEPLAHQDLVYSMGLIDYFKDRATVKIINRMYDMLKPGGEIIIGNFHVSCDSRVFLDYLLDWKLIYRTEDDMRRLFAQSAFGDSRVTIDFEQEGVNMLARCTKKHRLQ
ncbi:MAG: methyltransferase domain-containing protein [Cellvibrionaceae bacterium]|nr:methyltransferase domain-containing protein [Cellvibrionaceae bacterium]